MPRGCKDEQWCAWCCCVRPIESICCKCNFCACCCCCPPPCPPKLACPMPPLPGMPCMGCPPPPIRVVKEKVYVPVPVPVPVPMCPPPGPCGYPPMQGYPYCPQPCPMPMYPPPCPQPMCPPQYMPYQLPPPQCPYPCPPPPSYQSSRCSPATRCHPLGDFCGIPKVLPPECFYECDPEVELFNPCPPAFPKRLYRPGCPILPGYQGHIPGLRGHGAGRTLGAASKDTRCIMSQWGSCCPKLPRRIWEQ